MKLSRFHTNKLPCSWRASRVLVRALPACRSPTQLWRTLKAFCFQFNRVQPRSQGPPSSTREEKERERGYEVVLSCACLWLPAIMASIFKDFGCLSRVIFVVNMIGNVYISLYDFTSVVKRFVYRNEASDDSKINEETTSFQTQTTSLVQLCPGLLETPMAQFKKFHDFTVSCGHPLATVLVTHHLACRKCGNPLTVLEKKVHAVVIYHSERGTYLGSHVTKFCRNCKVYEH